MDSFPAFVKSSKNKVPTSQQNTDDIEGYFWEGADGSQVALWECHKERTSKVHTHNFDEYLVCISGEYIVYLDEKEIILKPGGELFIPKGIEQWGRCKSGTRTLHVFGGKRIRI